MMYSFTGVLLVINSFILVLFKPCFSAKEIFSLNQMRNLAITTDSSFKMDISMSIPIPMLGDVDVSLDLDIPLVINFMNHSIVYKPIKIPYIVWPETKPIVFDLRGNNDAYSYDSYYGSHYDSPYFPESYPMSDYHNRRNMISKRKSKTKNKSTKKRIKGNKKYSKIIDERNDSNVQNFTKQFNAYYRRHKRSLAASSAQHRSDIFAVLENTLDYYGFDGESCISRAVCEMAEMDLLIESPLHEVIEHLLRVSRAYDEDGILVNYLEAENHGHRKRTEQSLESCSSRYQCLFSIFVRS